MHTYLLSKLGNSIKKKFGRIELALVFLIGIGTLLNSNVSNSFYVLVILSFSALGSIYFIRAFAKNDDENVTVFERFFEKLAYMSLSTAIIGVLFNMNHWPSSELLLILASVFLIILLPLIVYYRIKNSEFTIFDNVLIVRIIIILGLCGMAFIEIIYHLSEID